MSRSARIAIQSFTALLALASLLAATPTHAEGTPTSVHPWAREFAAAHAAATSDFERTVLADDTITQAEYDEAVARFVACLRAEPQGFSVTAEPDPLIPGAAIYRGDIAPDVPPEVRQRIIASCQEGTTALIEPLFIATIVNPSHTDIDGLVLACLEAHGEAVTAGDLPALREDARTATARFNPSMTGATPDPATVACLVNPLGIGLEATPIASPHT